MCVGPWVCVRMCVSVCCPPFFPFKHFSSFLSSCHKVFLWLRYVGLCEAGQRRGSLGEKDRIWLIIYQCQPHNDSPCSPPIDEDNYISSEWLINKAQGKWFIIAPPKRLSGQPSLTAVAPPPPFFFKEDLVVFCNPNSAKATVWVQTSSIRRVHIVFLTSNAYCPLFLSTEMWYTFTFYFPIREAFPFGIK